MEDIPEYYQAIIDRERIRALNFGFTIGCVLTVTLIGVGFVIGVNLARD
jgi:hypothetical protein